MSYCVDHRILDFIERLFEGPAAQYWRLTRESECLEFTEPGGKHFEIVVREIDGRSDEATEEAKP